MEPLERDCATVRKWAQENKQALPPAVGVLGTSILKVEDRVERLEESIEELQLVMRAAISQAGADDDAASSIGRGGVSSEALHDHHLQSLAHQEADSRQQLKARRRDQNQHLHEIRDGAGADVASIPGSLASHASTLRPRSQMPRGLHAPQDMRQVQQDRIRLFIQGFKVPTWLKGAQGFDLTMTGRQIMDIGFFKRITSRPLKEPAFNAVLVMCTDVILLCREYRQINEYELVVKPTSRDKVRASIIDDWDDRFRIVLGKQIFDLEAESKDVRNKWVLAIQACDDFIPPNKLRG